MLESDLIKIGLPLSLFIIMLGMGLSLTIADFKRIGEQPRAFAVGTVGQLILIPLLGIAVGFTLNDPILAVGIVLIAALPGGTTSNVMTYLARGNLALSITLTVIASLATILTIPLVINFALDIFDAKAAGLTALPYVDTLKMIAAIIFVPMMIGMAIAHKFPNGVAQAEKMINIFAGLVFILIVIAVIIEFREQLPTWVAASWYAILLLNLGSVALAYAIAKLSGLTREDAIATMVELSIKNTTLGFGIVALMKNEALVAPSAVYSLLMYITAGLLVVWGRRGKEA